jgi:N-acylneuraminate cytidylyltransferase
MDRSRSVAIIPARGGSKRISRKNIREFRGKPLIAYTIDAALDSDLFDRVIVSTDDEAIADIAGSCGAEVPFRRPDALADDQTPVSEATVHALEQIDPEGYQYNHVAQLMANCPLRTAADIEGSYARFQDRAPDAQLSVFEFGWQNPWWALKMNGGGRLEPLFEEMFEQDVRSQDQPPLYCITGAVWWGKTEVVRSTRTFHVKERTGWKMPWHRAVDIDTEEDWHFAEALASMEANDAL